MNIDNLLKKAVELEASDIFITSGRPISAKVHGEIKNLTTEELTAEKARSTVLGLMDPKQQQDFATKKECNFALQAPGVGRFRVSAFVERFNVGAVLRRIVPTVPTLSDLNMPTSLGEFAMLNRGLVLLVGATGTGKSSTQAAMIQHRNSHASGHIISIEDPIEFVHKHEKCIITQREVGVDTDSFGIALKNALRQAPDVIAIGEIRSSDTMEYAIQFAETGHLCLATLHANNANQALDRIMSFFPAIKHQQVFLDLALHLKAIIAQQLIPNLDGTNRVAAMEIMTTTPAIQGCIKNGQIDLIKDFMIKGRNAGMQTFDQALFDLFKDKKISLENALKYADSESELRLKARLDAGGTDTGSLSGVALKD